MLYHLVEKSTWDAAVAAGEYPWSTRGLTLEQEGFVHASFAHQVPGTSERFYADVADLLLLTIDESLLTSPLVIEQINGAPEPFPHIYGPLDITAVVDVRSYSVGDQVDEHRSS
jgi:glutathione S-transferase